MERTNLNPTRAGFIVWSVLAIVLTKYFVILRSYAVARQDNGESQIDGWLTFFLPIILSCVFIFPGLTLWLVQIFVHKMILMPCLNCRWGLQMILNIFHDFHVHWERVNAEPSGSFHQFAVCIVSQFRHFPSIGSVHGSFPVFCNQIFH